MKKIAAAVILLCAMGNAFGQYALPAGANQLNVGIGFSNYGIPVYIGVDHGIHKDISLGGELSFRSYSDNWGGEKYRHAILGLVGNGNYHFGHLLGMPRAWDFYAGLNIGLAVRMSDEEYQGDAVSGVDLGLQVGGRYYFNNRWGMQLEFGGGDVASGGKFGLTHTL